MAELKFDKEELKNKAGAAVENIKQLDKDELKNKAGTAVQSLRQDVSDDEIQKNLDRLPIKNEYVKKYFTAIPAALSLIFTAFPFIKCSANNIDVDFSVLSTLGGEHISLANYFLVLLPALVIASMFVEKVKPFRKAVSVISPALCIVFEIWSFFIIKSSYIKAGEAGSSALKSVGAKGIEYSCIPHIAFYLLLVTYLLTIAAGLIVYFGWFPKKKSNGNAV